MRDREPERLRKSIRSLREQGVEAEFIVVDYGSSAKVRDGLEALSGTENFKLFRLESEGLPWNKCRAINFGVRQAGSEWIVTSDIDMIYDCNPLPYCQSNAGLRKVFIMQVWFLGEDGDRSRATFGGTGHPGGYVFQSRQAFFELGGYDEEIQYWGHEDWDWHNRLAASGYTIEWLPENFKFYHLWHPIVYWGKRKPTSAAFDTNKRLVLNTIRPVLDQNWGAPLGLSDRPVLEAVQAQSPSRTISIPAGNFMQHVDAILEAVREHRNSHTGLVLKLEIGARIIERRLSKFKKTLTRVFGKLFAKAGLILEDQVNPNFDEFYSLRPVFEEAGLKDYYLGKALDVVWLYFEPGGR